MTRRHRRPAALLSSLLLLAGCAPGLPLPGPSSVTSLLPEDAISCPPLVEAAWEARLYFGRSARDGGELSDAEWQRFLAEEVTSRFPDGLTVLDGYGQWRSGEDAPIEREGTKLLVIVVPDIGEALPKLRALSGIYKVRYDHESVLLSYQPVCVQF